MTTVGDIINLALKDIGVIAAGETADADTASDSLSTLTQLIGQWQAQKVYVTGQQQVSVTANGSQTYAVGPAGDFDIPLPVAVDSAFWRQNNIDYPLHVLSSFEDYEAITFKTLPGVVPTCVFYKRDYAQGTLYVWPQPSTGTLNLIVRDLLPTYAGLTDDIAVPAEYALALRYSLCELLLTTFGLPPRGDIAMLASRARKVMKRANLDIPILGQPQELLNHGRFSIYSGQ